jgi:hypothetical protein
MALLVVTVLVVILSLVPTDHPHWWHVHGLHPHDVVAVVPVSHREDDAASQGDGQKRDGTETQGANNVAGKGRGQVRLQSSATSRRRFSFNGAQACGFTGGGKTKAALRRLRWS